MAVLKQFDGGMLNSTEKPSMSYYENSSNLQSSQKCFFYFSNNILILKKCIIKNLIYLQGKVVLNLFFEIFSGIFPTSHFRISPDGRS